ncbi:MAG: hypothetical protein NC924_04260, partial [Candidatus Omnitrophica bacterium]|nr:hypothetical protein [Candidatus Omnitrophota bacterium]
YFPDAQGFFMRLLELIKEHEADQPDALSFLAYVEQAPATDFFVDVTGVEAITVLSIHKAKGLEFPVVIMPFFEIIPSEIGPRSRRGASYLLYEQESESLGLVRLDRKYTRFSQKLNEFFRLEYQRCLLDELNAAYVALTRAARELYIFVPGDSGNKHNAALQFVANLPVSPPPAAGQRHTSTDHAAAACRVLPLLQPAPWIAILREELVVLENGQARQRRVRGEALHALFARIGDVQREGVDAAIDAALAAGPELAAGGLAREEIRSLMRAVISLPAVRRFFYLEPHMRVHTEKTFIDRSGRAYRCDRLLLGPHSASVLDYKLSRAAAAAGGVQINTYLHVLREIFPERKLDGWVIYLEELQVEHVG